MNEFFSNLWGLNLAVFLLFGTAFYSIRVSGKHILHSFKDIKKNSWLFLSCIIVFIILNIVLFSFPFQCTEAWEELLMGKYIAGGDIDKFWFSHRHGVVYPYILGALFKILGTNIEIVSLITYVSAICCGTGIFLLTYLIFNDEKTSIYAVLLYIFSDFFFQYVLRYKDFHIFSSMLSVYSALFIILFIKTDKISLFLSGFSISLIAANTRSELFLYTVFLTFAWILRKRYLEQDISAKQKIVFFFLFACNLIITLMDIYNGRKHWGLGAAGDFNIFFYIKYIFSRIIDYAVIWFGRVHFIFLPLIIFAVTGIKKHLQNHAFGPLFLFLIFLFHSGVYIIFTTTSYRLEHRYIAMAAPLFFPFLGYGLFRLVKLTSNMILIVFLAIFLVSMPKIYMDCKKQDNILNSWQRYETVRDVFRLIDLTIPKNDPQKTLILVGLPEFAHELKFLTDMPISSFQDIKIQGNKIIMSDETPVSQIIYIHAPRVESMNLGDLIVDDYKKTAESFISVSDAKIGNIGNLAIYQITLPSETR